MSQSLAKQKRTRRRNLWALLLILPYAGLLFPQMYNYTEPSLWGFPFFYWYQFAWVILSSAITGFVYFKSKSVKSGS